MLKMYFIIWSYEVDTIDASDSEAISFKGMENLSLRRFPFGKPLQSHRLCHCEPA